MLDNACYRGAPTGGAPEIAPRLILAPHLILALHLILAPHLAPSYLSSHPNVAPHQKKNRQRPTTVIISRRLSYAYWLKNSPT